MHFKFVFCLNIKSNKIVSRCIEVCFALFLWCWGWNPGFCSCHESALPAACSPAPLARILSHHPHRNVEQSCHPQTPYHDPFVVNPTHSLSREPTNLFFFIPICLPEYHKGVTWYAVWGPASVLSVNSTVRGFPE